MFGVIEKLLAAIGGWFNYRSSLADNITELEVVDDKHDLEKAIKYAEDALEIVDKYGIMQPRGRKRYEYFVKKFRKYS